MAVKCGSIATANVSWKGKEIVMRCSRTTSPYQKLLVNPQYNIYFSVWWKIFQVESIIKIEFLVISYCWKSQWCLKTGWFICNFLPRICGVWAAQGCVSVLRHSSHVWLCVTSWTLALQAPLSTGFSRQEYWSGLPCPPPGDLPNSGIKPTSPLLQAESFLLSQQRIHCGARPPQPLLL